MQHIGIRAGTAINVPEAVQFATDISAYAAENLGWSLRVGIQHTGNADRVLVFSRNDSLDELLTRRASLMSDAGMMERMANIGDHFQAGSTRNFILRPLFEPGPSNGGDLLYFRMVRLTPNALTSVIGTCEEIVNHTRSEFGFDISVATEIGGGSDSLVWAVRFENGDAIEKGFEATMGDAHYNELVASLTQHTAGIEDRIVRLLPN